MAGPPRFTSMPSMGNGGFSSNAMAYDSSARGGGRGGFRGDRGGRGGGGDVSYRGRGGGGYNNYIHRGGRGGNGEFRGGRRGFSEDRGRGGRGGGGFSGGRGGGVPTHTVFRDSENESAPGRKKRRLEESGEEVEQGRDDAHDNAFIFDSSPNSPILGRLKKSTEFLDRGNTSFKKAILTIGEEKLHVSKELLAMHSSFFNAMFFGEFSDDGKEEVEINDVVYEEFVDLLQFIYEKRKKITDQTVPHIIKLSFKYQMKEILESSVKYLTKSKGFDVVKKLLLADQYRLDSLRDQCLASFTSAAELTEKLENILGSLRSSTQASVTRVAWELLKSGHQ